MVELMWRTRDLIALLEQNPPTVRPAGGGVLRKQRAVA